MSQLVAVALAARLVKILEDAKVMLRTCDSDRLMAGKVYRLANTVHSGLLEACKGVNKGTPEFDGIPEAWYKRWKQIDHPVYCLAYVLMPEYHATDQLGDPHVKKQVDVMLKRFFPAIA